MIMMLMDVDNGGENDDYINYQMTEKTYFLTPFLHIFVDFEDILVTVAYLLDKNEKTQFWCTYQERR